MTASTSTPFVIAKRLRVFALLALASFTHGWLTQPMPTSHRTWASSSSAATNTRLYRSKASSSNDNDESKALIQKEKVRFLGRGPNAIVRPGCVLVAPKHEFHHYYRRSAILIYGMGEAEDGSGDYVVRGLILDHPTPFTLKEMMDHQPQVVENPLSQNFLFRGGDKGGDGVILLHGRQDLNRPQIGMSGLYQGGWQEALELCKSGDTHSEDFKAFFNYCEFTEQELEDLLDSVEEGDAWVSLEVPADFCLNPDFDRGDAWSLLRNTIQQLEPSDPQP